MSSTLTSADKREIRLWIRDHIGAVRQTVERAKGLYDKVKDPALTTVVGRATAQAMAKFELADVARPEVEELATLAASDPMTPAAMILSPMFRLSREDLLDVAHWAGRTDGYAASMVQAEAFVRAVVRGNLEELRKERVPPHVPGKLKIKRRRRG